MFSKISKTKTQVGALAGMTLFDFIKAQTVNTQVWSQGLSCTFCIASGYTYVYGPDATTDGSYYYTEVTGSETYSYLASGSLNKLYPGFCCDSASSSSYCGSISSAAQYIGSSSANNAGSYQTSLSFDSTYLALAACPHRTEVCGDKNIELANSSAASETISVTGFKSSYDQCTWLIKATCDLPKITLSSINSSWETNVALLYLEWQDGFSGITFDSTWTSYPSVEMEPEYVDSQFAEDEGTLGEVYDTNNDYTDGSLIVTAISDMNALYDTYASSISSYISSLSTWNSLVEAYSDERDYLEDYTPTLLEELFGYDLDESNLPDYPTDVMSQPGSQPDAPSSYTTLYGYEDFSDYTISYGYGQFTAGIFSLSTDYEDTKYFGVVGQTSGSDSSPAGYAYVEDVSSGSCYARYIALTMYSLEPSYSQSSNSAFQLTVAAEANDSTIDLDTPSAPSYASSTSWSAADEPDVYESGALYLSVAATMITAGAMTIF